jgi:hypothetical protein
MIRFPALIALPMLALSTVPAVAQPKANDVQPDRIPFGTVYAGAIVEGSFLVYEAGRNADIPFEVTAPKFITVLHKATEVKLFGPGNVFTSGTVEFALDTSVVGDFSGEIRVTLGNAVAKVPVSATVKPGKKGLPRLLVVETPFLRYSTRHGADFAAWTDLVRDASLDVNYLLVTSGKPVLRDLDLGKFDCVLLAERGLVELQAADTKRVRAYAEAGGRVVVATSRFLVGTVEKANAVLDGYGIQMQDEEAEGSRSDVTLEESDFDPELVKAGVKSAHFLRASPVAVTNDKTGRVLAKAIRVGMPGDGFVAMAEAGKGEVIALGQSLWCMWIGEEKLAAGTDNALLLRRLLEPRKRK